MKRDIAITDELLVKYLLDEADAEECSQLETWINADEKNRKHYEQFRLIWEQSKQLELKTAVDPSAAWERFQQRVQPAAAAPVPRRVALFSFTRVAASLLLLVAAGLFWYRYRNPELIELHATDRPLTQTLADGSVVTLNRNATLRYPEHFRNDTRQVSLSGECFFNISPDKQKPFIIRTDDISIKVVGTSFNVKNNTKATEVIVETGIVEVSKAAQHIRLHPNEKTIIDKSTATLSKERSDDLFYNYYRTHEFVCNNTPLWRLAAVLSDAYQVEIVIQDPRIRALQLTTVFKEERLDSILAVICETFGIRAERKGNQILLQ